MILRYLVLFGGIVLMITGCNGLISQQFGTHRLRTVPLETAIASGLGDADFVELSGAIVGEPSIVGPALRSSDKDYVLRPVFTPEQQSAWAQGETVAVSLVSWIETEDPASQNIPNCSAPNFCALKGLLSAPTDKKNPVEQWSSQRVSLAPDVMYLQLDEAPMAWYWNLALLLGGLALALIPEALKFNSKPKET